MVAVVHVGVAAAGDVAIIAAGTLIAASSGCWQVMIMKHRMRHRAAKVHRIIQGCMVLLRRSLGLFGVVLVCTDERAVHHNRVLVILCRFLHSKFRRVSASIIRIDLLLYQMGFFIYLWNSLRHQFLILFGFLSRYLDAALRHVSLVELTNLLMDSNAPGQLIIGFSLVGLLNDAAIEGLVWTLIGML